MKAARPPEARGLVESLLRSPREAGTEGADAARERVAAFLRAHGWQVEEQRFSFSGGALLAFPLFGAGLGWLTLIAIPLLLLPAVPRWAALVAWLIGLAALAVLTAGLGLGWSRWGDDREDANLVATRPGGMVRGWFVAHLDTKAQGHSMAGRLVAVWACVAVVPLFLALCLWRLVGPLSPMVVAAGAGAALAAGVLAGRGRLRGESPGARDNGTGLCALLELATTLRDPGAGLLVTGAEEFGLVGARIMGRVSPERVRGTTVINFDTIDETGPLRIVAHDGPGRALAERLRPVLGNARTPVRLHRLPAGIFVDSLPMARTGARAVTIARLDWSTLRKIHTPRDTLDALSLETPRRLAGVLAGFDLSGADG